MPPSFLQSSTSGLSTSSDSSRLDLADQREIEATWKEVHAKVIELAGGDPSRVRQTLTIDEVLNYIDSVQKTETKKAEEHGTFKNVVSKTLQCINTIGGIVADGASNAFAPAGMCYNALTFVIQAWQGYEGTFANLGELLEKCVDFFERLQSYQGRMDSALIRLASQNLRLFVEICDRTIKLRKKHSRFLRFTKQLFLNDDGVQDMLALMDKLNSKEALLVNAQTYRLVSDSAGDIKLILDAQKELRREDDVKKWRRSIAKALGFPGTTLDIDGEPIPSWQRAFDTRLNSLVEGTGLWWKTDDIFSRWATARYPEAPILVLSGKGGTGKTSMMASTIKSIRRLGLDAPSSRVVAVYYFVDGDKRKLDEEDESSYLQRVSRTLLWQLATSYEAMTKSMALIVERATQFSGSLDRWDQLFFNNKECQNSNTTFYLFIDGFDKELIPLYQRFCKQADRAQLRIFLTGRPELIANYLSQAEGVDFTHIPITDRNGQDIEKYTISQMDNMPMLRDTSRQGISEWRQTIMEELRDKCAGDYFKLNTGLTALAKVDLIEDIREVLEEAGKTRLDQIDAELRRLNNIRTIKEIREINEIILWVDYGRRFFTVETLESILSVKHRGPSSTLQSTPQLSLVRRQTSKESTNQTSEPAVVTTISLLPLAQKLREKYPIFSITDSGVVDWRSSEIKSRIPTQEHQHEVKIDGEAPSRSRVIQESEISIVRHFLSTVCPEELYQRFEFEEFFDTKLGARFKEHIRLDPENADARIVLTCLVILTDEELRKKEKIRQYAVYWLLDHLQAVDLSAADRELKGQVGQLLVRLFTEECGVDSLFWPFDINVSMKTWDQGEAIYLREARNEWVYSTAGVYEIARWFHDSSVSKNVTSEVGQAFVAAIKTPTANLHQVVLSFAARHMATHLFLRIEFLKRHFLAACCFLRGFLARLNGKEMPNDPAAYQYGWEGYSNWEGDKFPLSQLEEIEAWACTKLVGCKDTPEQESLWEIHGALQAFQLCDNENEKSKVSQHRARKALELNPRNWHACHFVSGRPDTSTEDGVKLLTRAKDAVDNDRAKDDDWMKNSANTALLARITFDLGNKLWEFGDFTSGARTHRESLGYDYVHFTAYGKVLSRYQENQQWDELIAFIEALNQTSNIWDAYFDELVIDFVADLVDKESDMLAQAADATNRWDVIETFFTIATDIGNQQRAYDLLFLLRDGFARTLELTAGTVDENSVIATRMAALESIQSHPSDTVPRTKIYNMTNSLAQIYLDKAFRPNTSEEKVESLGSSISALLPDVSDMMSAWENIMTVCCIVRYHHKLQTKSRVEKRWIERIVSAGLELLSDSDEDNDDSAYWLLARLFDTVEDVENSRIAWTMRNRIQAQAMEKWDEWVKTPLDSPTQKRILPPEPVSSKSAPIVPRIDSNPSLNAIEGERSRSRSSGRASVHSHSDDTLKDIDKPVRMSSAPPVPGSAHESDDDIHVRVPPKKISTDIVESAPYGAPPKPTWFVSCDGCGGQWTVMDEPLYTCADCVGTVQLDHKCHELLMNDQLKKKGLVCKKEHKFLEVPSFDEERFKDMPQGCVPLPDSKGNEKRWITLDEWKNTLRQLYLPDPAALVAA
ncbi:hypothetical protein F5Y19DRAFT_425266 [Xylariaceae sp. FL1651]|nr:hypothetical protein F5Y19DRAFT_425266 [Xylariaceae sp. FL1651]